MSKFEVFDEPMIGTVNFGHYTNTVHQFVWCVENDLAIWYFSKTFELWFKEEEIDFDGSEV